MTLHYAQRRVTPIWFFWPAQWFRRISKGLGVALGGKFDGSSGGRRALRGCCLVAASLATKNTPSL